jgi:uroporphyrinogen decarboxylase
MILSYKKPMKNTSKNTDYIVGNVSSVQRIKALAEKRLPDRVPVIPSAGAYAAVVSGMPLAEFYLEPDKAFHAQLWAAELHGYDGNPVYSIPEWGGWDFGGELRFPSSPPYALPLLDRRPVQSPEDAYKLKVPDVETAPAASRMLSFASLAREKGAPATLPAGSPMGLAGSILGADLLLKSLIKNQKLIHHVLRLATDYLLAIADTFIKRFGAENCAAFATYPWESHTVVAPSIFKKFSLPFVKEIHEYLLQKGVKRWLIHLCGDHTRNLSCWAKEIPLAPRTVFSIGDEMDLKITASSLGEEYIIGGNISTSLIHAGSPDEIMNECAGILDAMKYWPGGFILMPACALPPLTPPVNLHAIIKAATLYGSYSS